MIDIDFTRECEELFRERYPNQKWFVVWKKVHSPIHLDCLLETADKVEAAKCFSEALARRGSYFIEGAVLLLKRSVELGVKEAPGGGKTTVADVWTESVYMIVDGQWRHITGMLLDPEFV